MSEPHDPETREPSDKSVIAALRNATSDNDSAFYARRVFTEVDTLLRRGGLSHPRSILEIGPGANLGSLACFAQSGVQRCAALDVAYTEPRDQEFYDNLVALVQAVDGFKWWRPFSEMNFPGVRFPATEPKVDPGALLRGIERVTWTPMEETTPLEDGAFDAVYSIAALEHVEKPRSVLSEAKRVLAPGGLMVHEIDLTHHSSMDPLLFLTLEEDEWLTRAGKYGRDVTLRRILDKSFDGEIYSNRLRIDDWLRLFGELELKVLSVEPLITYESGLIQRNTFVEPFRSKALHDLSILAFRTVLTHET